MGEFTSKQNSCASLSPAPKKYKPKSKAIVAIASAAICFSGLGITAPVNASETATGAANVGTATAKLSAADWREIAKRARSAGDTTGAEAAQQMSTRTANNLQASQHPNKPVRPHNIVTTVVKKAVIAALRHGGNKLPKKIRPYSQKILHFLEDLEKWQEGPIITGLMAAGLPYDIASYTATWIVTFAGV